MLSVAYCVLYVADLPTMTHFYHDTLGLPIAEQNARFVAFSGPGTPLALETGGPTPDGPRGKDRNPTLAQFATANIEATIATLAKHGVSFEGEIRRGPYGALAFFRDPEGNRLALLQAP
jgi:predicted enzyme related to lactoylglutathione lyase